MSFISKLFRKTDSDSSAEDVPVRAAEHEAAADLDALPQDAVSAAPGDTVEQDMARESEKADEQPAPTAPEAVAEDERAARWWEEDTPAQTDASSDKIAAEPRRTATGTAPLEDRDDRPRDTDASTPATSLTAPAIDSPVESPGTESGAGAAEQSANDDEEGGTRPLTAADVPALAALRSRRGLAAAAMRDIGRVRQINQDSVFALITTLPREGGDISIGLFIVADGMGGHHGGEVASRMAISTVAHYVLAELVVPALTDGATEALQPLIVAAVQEANRAIWEHGQLVGSDMGTTCTVALLLGRALYVGHVGDSRAYLATPTGLRQITDDHSTVGRLIKLGQLDPSEAREHPLRSQLYRTIGQQPEVPVDFIYQQIGDATHLLMGSDGLWGMLDDEVMLDVLDHSLWPQDACNELIARANLAGGDDNITAIVVSLPA